MKKKTMQRLFISLFVVGIIVGYLLPGDFFTLGKKISEKPLKFSVIDVSKKFGQLDKENEYFKYTELVSTDLSSAELLRLEGAIPEHSHPNQIHYAYVYKGKSKITVGSEIVEAGPGSFVIFPKGVTHQIERIGDSPVEVLLFSSPAFDNTFVMQPKK
ncbi:MAG TPA: cupin domain-containing protein [Candidatus Nanoarchaeia archaeon]|nr:cupin domain-containing protein [Candidatus Nanoarchaeia archaeon]